MSRQQAHYNMDKKGSLNLREKCSSFNLSTNKQSMIVFVRKRTHTSNAHAHPFFFSFFNYVQSDTSLTLLP